VSSFSTLNPSNYVSGCKTINSVGNEYDLSPLGPRIARMTVTLKKSVKRGNQNPYIKEEQTT
jgi:hypothetical protein